jgi:hypothetical protein
MGLTEEAGKVGTATVTALSGSPMAIAILIVNVVFLGFLAFVLGRVAENGQERNKAQADLIAQLVADVRGCRQEQH